MSQLTAITENDIRCLQEQIALGNERAFRQLFDFFSEKLFRFAFAIIKTKDGATEVVDEVFVKIWKQRTNIAGIELFKNIPVYICKKRFTQLFITEGQRPNNRII